MNTFMNLNGISIAHAAFMFQFAHTILGLVLILVGIFALIAYQYPNKPKLASLWPWADLIGSIVIMVYITFMFGANNFARWLWISAHSNELLEHGIIITAIVIGALTVILHQATVLKSKHWMLRWGVAVLIYGFLFMLHPQDQLGGKEGIYSVQYHHWCGFVGFVTGILYILNIYLGNKITCFKFLWPTALITNGFMWMFYHINPAGFHSFATPAFFQLAVEPTLALGVTLSLLVLLIGGLICREKP